MPRWWLFLALTGRRIEEAIGLKPDDLGSDNMLHIRRVIYNGRMEELDEEQLRWMHPNIANWLSGFAVWESVPSGCSARAEGRLNPGNVWRLFASDGSDSRREARRLARFPAHPGDHHAQGWRASGRGLCRRRPQEG